MGCQKKSGRSIWECLSEIPQNVHKPLILKFADGGLLSVMHFANSVLAVWESAINLRPVPVTFSIIDLNLFPVSKGWVLLSRYFLPARAIFFHAFVGFFCNNFK